MLRAGLAPLREAAAARSPVERVRYHAARWALLALVAVATRLSFPPPATGLALTGASAWIIGPLLYDAALPGVFWLLLLFYRRETWDSLREMSFFTGLFVLVIALSGLLQHEVPGRPELIPISFAAILVTVLYHGRLSVFAAVTLAIVVGLQWELRDTPALFFGLAAGLSGALGIKGVRHRRESIRAIAVIALAMAFSSLAVGLREGWTWHAIADSALAGGVLALGSVSVAMALLPIAESVTGRTTDLTLLELGDPAAPLLRRLAAEAPGTWAHTLAVANLCESACDAIGANGLLGRVGSYYHDIGKLERPECFVENQVGGVNPHDSLPPDESGRLIRQHVTAGLVLAETHGLPASVRVFIAEHHGTTRLNYFADRGMAQGGNDDSPYRYPGPRPRSAETAIVMLADASEASVRVLDEASPRRVRETIAHLVRQRIATGELNDAPLTLRELDRVMEVFTRILTGMNHSRPEYPAEHGGITAGFARG
jgi:putative nucleotidyltransferase with HDIG domain